jgi:hypothetical protein
MAIGICTPGQRRCEQGKWSACTGVVAAEQEVCDGIDNDCNGVRDNSPRDCASNEQCQNGSCVCVPRRSCASLDCGVDDCGTSCGTCPTTRTGGDAMGGKCYTGSCGPSGTCDSSEPIRCLLDSDRDGYPAANSTRELCAVKCPDGFLDMSQSRQSDCNDRDPECFPGNPNWYMDSKDHNCNGKVDIEVGQDMNWGCEPACSNGSCIQAHRQGTSQDCGGTTRVCEINDACTTGSACTIRPVGYPIRCK